VWRKTRHRAESGAVERGFTVSEEIENAQPSTGGAESGECPPQAPEPDRSPEAIQVRRFLCAAFEIIAILAGLYFVCTFLYISFSRLGYPFEVEWMEGGMVDHGARIMRGEGLYVEPSLEFIPYLYPPLYPFVLALGYWVFGICLWWGRLVSIVSTLAACAIAFRWIWVATGRWRLGAVSVGLFLAGFHACGSWFDINRVDMLLLALLAGGMYLLRGNPERRRLVAGAVLLGAAFFAKQFAIIFLVGGAVAAFLHGRKSGLIFCAVGFGIAGVFTGLLAALTGGWSWYYCFTVPSQHGMDWLRIGSLWRGDVIHRFPFQLAGCVACATAWFFTAKRFSIRRIPVVLVAAVSAITASFFGRIHFGGYDNTLIPMAFFTTVFLLIAAGRLAGAEWSRPRACAVLSAVSILILFQFYIHIYPVKAQVPAGAERESGERFLEAARSVDGDVFIPFHGYYWSRTGKKMRFHIIALHDIITFREKDRKGDVRIVQKRELIPEDIIAAFNEKRFAAVIPNLPKHNYYLRTTVEHLIYGNYVRSNSIPQLPRPKTGMGTRTGAMWFPKGRPAPNRP